MNKSHRILLFLAVLIMSSPAFCGTIEPGYEVGTWQGFKQAAITFSHDDGCSNQYAIAIPLYNQYNMKGTFFLTTNALGNWIPWEPWIAAACQGHEIASHTVTHPNLSTLSSAEQITEISESQDAINANIPCQNCLTIAYPFCVSMDYATLAQYYIAGRNCSGLNPATPSNFYEIASSGVGENTTTNDVIALFDQADTTGGWCVLLIHGIDNDGGYSPISSTVLTESVQYLDANKGIFWVGTFVNVVCYIKERNDASVAETSATATAITVSVTDTLDNAIYNYPISIRRRLPVGWAAVSATQNDHSIDCSIVQDSGANYIMFNAVPDAGPVVLTKAGDLTPPAAPTGLTASLDGINVALDWNDNSEQDIGGYNIYRSTTSGSGYVKINTAMATSSDYIDRSAAGNKTYYYVVTAVNTSFNESDNSNEASITTPATALGTILYERWNGISGTAVSDLTSNAAYPDNPSFTGQLSTLEGPTDILDDYGTRIRGYLYPPATGNYTFWVAGDDNCELWLSTDSSPANASLIASVPGWASPRAWNVYPEQQSSPVTLTAGQKYYIEVLHKEGYGGDNIAAAWSGPGMSQAVIEGQYLSPWPIGLYGDFSGNGFVTVEDLSLFAERWVLNDCILTSAIDLDGDCVVDFYEFSQFAQDWMN